MKQDLTISEAADLLGLSEKTISRAISTGELPCIRVNQRVIRLTKVDVSIWYLSRRKCP